VHSAESIRSSILAEPRDTSPFSESVSSRIVSSSLITLRINERCYCSHQPSKPFRYARNVGEMSRKNRSKRKRNERSVAELRGRLNKGIKDLFGIERCFLRIVAVAEGPLDHLDEQLARATTIDRKAIAASTTLYDFVLARCLLAASRIADERLVRLAEGRRRTRDGSSWITYSLRGRGRGSSSVGHCERLSVWRQTGVLTFTDLTQHTIIRRDPPREAAGSLTIAAQNYAACDGARSSQGIPFVDPSLDWKNRIDIARVFRDTPTIPGDSWHRSDNARRANDPAR